MKRTHYILLATLVVAILLGWGLSARFSSVTTLRYSFETENPSVLSLSLTLPLPDYRDYREKPRPVYDGNLTWNEMAGKYLTDSVVIASDPGDDAFIRSLARQFEEKAAAENLDAKETVELVLKFAQGMTYTTDNVSTSSDEYPRYPLETLFEQAGDCEDTSLLAAAVLTEMGYDTAFLLFEKFDHMGLGVYFPEEWGVKMYGNSWVYGDKDGVIEDDERRYWYLDTSGKRSIGWAPPEYGGTPAYVYPLR